MIAGPAAIPFALGIGFFIYFPLRFGAAAVLEPDKSPDAMVGVLAQTGPWAMFRLFGQGTLQQAGSPERYTLSFSLGGRSATFELRAASVMNPFAPGVLQDFRCPSVSG